MTAHQTALLGFWLVLSSANCFARGVPAWSFDELWKKADIVVIIEPLKTEKNPDQLTIPWDAGDKFQGLTTHFKVHGVLKGGPLGDDLVLKHFDFTFETRARTTIITDGPSFVAFTPGPLAEYDTVTKDGKQVRSLDLLNQTPLYLAFLMRAPDGSCFAVTGQVDPSYSFQEMRTVCPSWMQ